MSYKCKKEKAKKAKENEENEVQNIADDIFLKIIIPPVVKKLQVVFLCCGVKFFGYFLSRK